MVMLIQRVKHQQSFSGSFVSAEFALNLWFIQQLYTSPRFTSSNTKTFARSGKKWPTVSLTHVVDYNSRYTSAGLDLFHDDLKKKKSRFSSRFKRSQTLQDDQGQLPSPRQSSGPASVRHSQPHEVGPFLTDLLGAPEGGTVFGKRTFVLCVEGHNLPFCLDWTLVDLPAAWAETRVNI